MVKLTTLSHSGGVQSQGILEMMLRGDIAIPKPFLVLNADPGMENRRTHEFVKDIAARCEAVGIRYIRAKGPNLKEDLLTFKERGATRIDNPPYWTKNRETGKRGTALQKCTAFYKIKPMRRELRLVMREMFGVSLESKRLPKVESWIGFAADEANRAAKATSDVKFINLRFPLIEMGLSKAQVVGYFLKHSIQRPPPSVCNACFSHGLNFLRDMHDNRPDEWDEAVQIDEAIRDMRQVGINDEVYVSKTLIPLRTLAELDFNVPELPGQNYKCNSGVCFV